MNKSQTSLVEGVCCAYITRNPGVQSAGDVRIVLRKKDFGRAPVQPGAYRNIFGRLSVEIRHYDMLDQARWDESRVWLISFPEGTPLESVAEFETYVLKGNFHSINSKKGNDAQALQALACLYCNGLLVLSWDEYKALPYSHQDKSVNIDTEEKTNESLPN